MPTVWDDWVRRVNDERARQLLERVPRVLCSTECAVQALVRDGHGASRPITLFSCNDYLGLASHPDVKRAVRDAAAKYGNGTRSAAIVSGHTDHHEALEGELAALKHTDACLLFPSGFAANFGSIAALCAGGGVDVFSDELNHASLIDGVRMATRKGDCRLHVFPHRDYDRLRAQLLSSCDPARRQLVITDGVFSMDGDVADLKELARLKRQFGFLLMVDDAHGTLVLGERGGGTAEAAGVDADVVDLHCGTLSKAFGALGGFVACSAAMKLFLLNHARSYTYSTALPVPVVVGALAALRIARRDTWLLCHLRRLMDKMARALQCEVVTPIIPVVVGAEDAALQLCDRLWDAGMHCPAIRPPTVPKGSSRLRITLTAQHTEADVDRLLAALGAQGVLPGSPQHCDARPLPGVGIGAPPSAGRVHSRL